MPLQIYWRFRFHHRTARWTLGLLIFAVVRSGACPASGRAWRRQKAKVLPWRLIRWPAVRCASTLTKRYLGGPLRVHQLSAYGSFTVNQRSKRRGAVNLARNLEGCSRI